MQKKAELDRKPAAKDQVAPAQTESTTVRAQGGVSGGMRQSEGNAAAGAESGVSAADRARPEAWLDAIRRLAAEGRLDEARRELHDFQSRHPDRKLPDDLARLLE